MLSPDAQRVIENNRPRGFWGWVKLAVLALAHTYNEHQAQAPRQVQQAQVRQAQVRRTGTTATAPPPRVSYTPPEPQPYVPCICTVCLGPNGRCPGTDSMTNNCPGCGRLVGHSH